MKKPSDKPERPKYCPRGHQHLSWSKGDDHAFCWDCNRKYLVSECVDGGRSVDGVDGAGKERG